ncbi:MAG: ERF family protein [Pseudomonadota bacterium]
MSDMVKVEASPQDRFLTMVEHMSGTQLTDADLVKFGRIMDMQIQYRDYQAKQDFSRAAATAQGKIGLILRDKERASGPIKGNYASFDQMVAQSKEILADHGLSISFNEVIENEQPGILHMEAIYRHVGTHHEIYNIKVPFDTSSNKSAVWAKGSAITYAKKYLYSMILCLGTGDDDDGLVATTYVPEGISAMQKANLMMLVEQAESSIDKLYRRYNVACVDDLSQAQYENACEGLTDKINSRKAVDAEVLNTQPENFLNV